MCSEISFSGVPCLVTVVLLILAGVFQVERIHCSNPSVQVLVEKKPSKNAGLTRYWLRDSHNQVRFLPLHLPSRFFNNGQSYWAKNLNASGKQIKECSCIWLWYCGLAY